MNSSVIFGKDCRRTLATDMSLNLANIYIQVNQNLNKDIFLSSREVNLIDFGEYWQVGNKSISTVTIRKAIYDMIYQDSAFYDSLSAYDIILNLLDDYYDKKPDDRSSDEAIRNYLVSMMRRYPDFRKIVRYVMSTINSLAYMMPDARVLIK